MRSPYGSARASRALGFGRRPGAEPIAFDGARDLAAQQVLCVTRSMSLHSSSRADPASQSQGWSGRSGAAVLGTGKKGQMAHPNQEVVEAAYSAFQRRDMDALYELLPPRHRLAHPGRAGMAGEIKGAEAAVAALSSLGELTGGALRMEIHDALASEDHVVALVSEHAEPNGWWTTTLSRSSTSGTARLPRSGTCTPICTLTTSFWRERSWLAKVGGCAAQR
jgi:SnoaL-like domain